MGRSRTSGRRIVERRVDTPDRLRDAIATQPDLPAGPLLAPGSLAAEAYAGRALRRPDHDHPGMLADARDALIWWLTPAAWADQMSMARIALQHDEALAAQLPAMIAERLEAGDDAGADALLGRLVQIVPDIANHMNGEV